MGLFDFFRKKPTVAANHAAAAESVPLEQSCYDMAYFLLPQIVHETFGKLLDLYTNTPSVAGPFYYIMACQLRGIEPNMESARRFHWHQGVFDGERSYLVLEYPTPPPVDMGDSDPISLMQAGVKIVLAPYYSAVLYGDHSAPEYFILGQAPIGGGTTVRCVLADGMNCNLGPGPAPSLEAFLDAIRERESEGTS